MASNLFTQNVLKKIEDKIDKKNHRILMEGISYSIFMFISDSQINHELSYTSLDSELKDLKKSFKNTTKIIENMPETSIVKTFSNTNSHLRDILSTKTGEQEIQKTPAFKKHIFDALYPLTLELTSSPKETLITLFQILINSTVDNPEIKALKSKQLVKEKEKELVFNIAYVFKFCGGKIGCKDTDLFNEIINLTFIEIQPKKEKNSICDFLNKTCGGRNNIINNIKGKRFMNKLTLTK